MQNVSDDHVRSRTRDHRIVAQCGLYVEALKGQILGSTAVHVLCFISCCCSSEPLIKQVRICKLRCQTLKTKINVNFI